MPQSPKCVQERYQILDDLVKDLKYSDAYSDEKRTPTEEVPLNNNGAAIRLMCNMWYALKENPNFDVTQLVEDNLESNKSSSPSIMFGPSVFQCYPTSSNKISNDLDVRSVSETLEKIKSGIRKRSCCRGKDTVCSIKSTTSNTDSIVPLNKVLCDLTDAVSFDQKCTTRLNVLLETEKRLSEHITKLEMRERDTQELIREAECMWSCMNEMYNKNIAIQRDKQRDLRVKLTNIESAKNKWRNRCQDLQKEKANLNKCHKDIKDKIRRKGNDLKSISKEVESLKNKIDDLANEMMCASKTTDSRKSQGDKNINNANEKITELESRIVESKQKRETIIIQGKDLIQEVRTELANIEKVLFDKQIEEHNLNIMKDGLADEIIFLRTRTKTCDSNCKKQKKLIREEIDKVVHEISTFRAKCTKCAKANDTSDMRKFCTDCERCLKQQTQHYDVNDLCYYSQIDECICVRIKTKLMDNVLENMYTVLMKYCESEQAKKVANSVFDCLQKTKNGKLNVETKKCVQNFVLDTIRRDLNVTIVGGAIKTRCELDPDSYRQLMLCIESIKTPSVHKIDQGVDVKKQPCNAWESSIECYCPKGPKKCICNSKAPKRPSLSRSNSIRSKAEKDKTEKLRPASCKETSCNYKKNATAAQCSINSIELITKSRSKYCESAENNNSEISVYNSMNEIQKGCLCQYSFHKDCPIHSDFYVHPRERLIDEVLGRLNDETKSVEKILSYDIIDLGRQSQMRVITLNSNDEPSQQSFDNYKRCIVIKSKLRRNASPIQIAIMRQTKDGDFDVMLDKEYNTELKGKLIELHMNIIYLSKIKSDTYVLNFLENDDNCKEINAVVLKNLSSEIKILNIDQNVDEFILNNCYTKICNAIIDMDEVDSIQDTNTDILTYTVLLSNKKNTNYSMTNLIDKNENYRLRKSVTFENGVPVQSSDSQSSCSLFDDDEPKDKNTFVSSFSIDYLSRKDIKIQILDFGLNIKTEGNIVKESNNFVVYFKNSSDSQLYRLKSYLSVYKKCYLPIKMSDNDESLIIFLNKDDIDPKDVTYALLRYSFASTLSIIIDEISMAKIYNRTKLLRSFTFIASQIAVNESVNVSVTNSVSSGLSGLLFDKYKDLFPNEEWLFKPNCATFSKFTSKRM